MSKIGSQSCFAGAASQGQVRINLNRVSGLLVLALLLGVGPAWADEPDDEYLQIYNLIQQADDVERGRQGRPGQGQIPGGADRLDELPKELPGVECQTGCLPIELRGAKAGRPVGKAARGRGRHRERAGANRGKPPLHLGTRRSSCSRPGPSRARCSACIRSRATNRRWA